MDVEPQSAASSPIVTASQLKISPATQTPGLRSRDDSSAATGPSSSRSKGRGTKSRMINVGGNRLKLPATPVDTKTSHSGPQDRGVVIQPLMLNGILSMIIK
ncbi:hypothetical protein Pst134EA_032783 [Puccinia striiformis f. sp. tritici]|uniref:uncharacterized protein n=1 Tax=Puccinia striiformis f. sp. tritici TaxID=168172 RepID=UPI002007D06F|nr:uncharacterized protein Pst134EA_032783 [Puccinia striiformis f. sp. tritici]KAH9441616.1 hypothetical protein Pst134EA_032783 [Puccinia striiformis f. sp. tritici]